MVPGGRDSADMTEYCDHYQEEGEAVADQYDDDKPGWMFSLRDRAEDERKPAWSLATKLNSPSERKYSEGGSLATARVRYSQIWLE